MPGDCGVVLQLLNCGLETQIEDPSLFSPLHARWITYELIDALVIYLAVWIHSIEIDWDCGGHSVQA
jgi:hypothetical protein